MLSQRDFGELCVVIASYRKFGELACVNNDWI